MQSRFLALAAATALLSVVSAGAVRADPPPVEAYGRLPQVENVAMAPAGKRVAFVMASAKGREIVVTEGGKQIFAAPAGGGKGKIRDIEWADDDHLVIAVNKTEDLSDYDASNGLHEILQVAVINVTTRKAFWVFSSDMERVMNAVYGVYGFATRGGHAYGYFAGQPGEKGKGLADRIDLFEVDLDTGPSRRGRFRAPRAIRGSAGPGCCRATAR